MRILFDTNVILDVLLDRTPFVRDAAWLVDQVARRKLKGLLGATSVTTIYYLSAKSSGREQARNQVEGLLHRFNIASVHRVVLAEAVETDFADYEDAVLYRAALHAEAGGIVTRNPDDFRSATITIYQPAELRAALEAWT